MRHIREERFVHFLIALALLNVTFTVSGCNYKRGTVISQTDTTDANPGINRDTFSYNPQDTSLRYIYLTFDDGPQHGTMNCYHICKSLGVKATFFMVGQHADNRLLRSFVDSVYAGYPFFFLANHSYTHAYRNHYKKFYGTPSQAQLDFIKAEDSLHIPYRIVRFPGNNTWTLHSKPHGPKLTLPLAKFMDSTGYDVVGWDIEWRFKGTKSTPVQSVETMIKTVDSYANSNELRTKKHIVILAHDRMFGDTAPADSLQKFITVLKKNPRFVFETIDKYPGIKKNKGKI
ncbi:polysaccharide deacetylase family protein [Foetidibacter luteolus]|uniref:polysaccharide deacetylase family protein n=1 Tax=Foetidibacter luteolus TaxID=2608880 RepID=UPI00129A2FD0|nr:polysaccharide deacetylase family protein [Foetidibacter luteolus]